MLTNTDYDKGMIVFEQNKYNIHYCKKPLYDIVYNGFVNRLMNYKYSDELTDEQITLLNNLINK